MTSRIKLKDVYSQVLVALVICLMSVFSGVSNSLTNMLHDKINIETKSVIASSITTGMMLGLMLDMLITNRIGRRKTVLTICFTSVISWILIAISTHTDSLLMRSGIFLTGFTRGGLTGISGVVLSETINKHHRAASIFAATFFIKSGVMLTGFFSLITTWNLFKISMLVFSVTVYILAYCFVIESPYWLSRVKNDLDGAKISLKLLNPNKQMFHEEWNELKENTNIKNKRTASRKTFLRSIAQPSVYKPILITAGLQLISQTNSLVVITFYLSDIIKLMSIEIGTRYLKEAFLGCGTLKSLGSITVFLLSFIHSLKIISYITSLACIIVSFAIYMLYVLTNTYYIEWIKIILLGVYISLEKATKPLTSELLPNEIRGVCDPLFNLGNFAIVAAIVKFYPLILNTIGVQNIFLFYSLTHCALILYIYYMIPETKGKSLDEIENYFFEDKKQTGDAVRVNAVEISLINDKKVYE